MNRPFLTGLKPLDFLNYGRFPLYGLYEFTTKRTPTLLPIAAVAFAQSAVESGLPVYVIDRGGLTAEMTRMIRKMSTRVRSRIKYVKVDSLSESLSALRESEKEDAVMVVDILKLSNAELHRPKLFYQVLDVLHSHTISLKGPCIYVIDESPPIFMDLLQGDRGYHREKCAEECMTTYSFDSDLIPGERYPIVSVTKSENFNRDEDFESSCLLSDFASTYYPKHRHGVPQISLGK